MEFTIRTYQNEDFGTVTSLMLESWKSSGVVAAQAETLDYLRDRFPELIARGASIHVAILDSEIVGALAFRESKVSRIFVTPAAQGKGIGKQLLDFAKAKNPTGFWLTTPVENGRAIQFYEREGLKRGEIGRHKRLSIDMVRFDWVPNSK